MERIISHSKFQDVVFLGDILHSCAFGSMMLLAPRTFASFHVTPVAWKSAEALSAIDSLFPIWGACTLMLAVLGFLNERRALFAAEAATNALGVLAFLHWFFNMGVTWQPWAPLFYLMGAFVMFSLNSVAYLDIMKQHKPGSLPAQWGHRLDRTIDDMLTGDAAHQDDKRAPTRRRRNSRQIEDEE